MRLLFLKIYSILTVPNLTVTYFAAGRLLSISKPYNLHWTYGDSI